MEDNQKDSRARRQNLRTAEEGKLLYSENCVKADPVYK